MKSGTSYGAKVPGTEGRASMITIVGGSDLDLDHLYQGVMEKLPSYARPIFVRLAEKVDMTSTYKLKKTKLQRQGFDIDCTDDPIFFMDNKNAKYVPLTKALHDDIISGKLRL